MRTVRVHLPLLASSDAPLSPEITWALPPDAGHHVARVLRLKAGDALNVFDGLGAEYNAVVDSVRGTQVNVCVVGERLNETRESPLSVTLAQGLSRGARMDYAIQKAVELGVTAIQPLATQRSVVRLNDDKAAKRLTHWQQVAASACEQCGRSRVPPVTALTQLEVWLGTPVPDDGPRFVLDPGAPHGLNAHPAPGRQPVTLLVGPEGGLSEEELALVEQRGFARVRLGPRVLRTETAAVAALTALQSLWGDLAT